MTTEAAHVTAYRKGRQRVAHLNKLCGPLDLVFWNAQIEQDRAGAAPMRQKFLDGMADAVATLLVATS